MSELTWRRLASISSHDGLDIVDRWLDCIQESSWASVERRGRYDQHASCDCRVGRTSV
jgi:hypothetical protein